MWQKNTFLCIILASIAVSVTQNQLLDGEKQGVCPEFTTPNSDLCVIECNEDNECPGDNKCCPLLSCGSMCTPPLLSTTNKPVDGNSTKNKTDKCANECDSSRSCGAFTLCVRKGCKRVCKSFSNKKVKHKTNPPLIPQIPILMKRNCTDQCLRDMHCDLGQVCIPKGCKNICIRKGMENQAFQGPLSVSVDEDCNDRCARHSHCPLGYECIQQGCRNVCFKSTNTTVMSTVSNNYHKSCENDLDCHQGFMCVRQGCRTLCTVVKTQTKSTKHGSDSCRNECNVDIDCRKGLNCIKRGCKRICQYDQRKQSSLGNIPIPSIKTSSVQHQCNNECNVDGDCNFGFRCRQYGCRRICRHDLSDGFVSDSSVAACRNKCEKDTDCDFGLKCLQNGCKKECIKNNDSTSNLKPPECQDECRGSTDCSGGFICVKSGCKTTCQSYQSLRNNKITKCKNECKRDADCSVGYKCARSGCDIICLPIVTKHDKLQENNENCNDQCVRNSDCKHPSVCTRRGCRRICVSLNNFMPAGPASPFQRGDPINQFVNLQNLQASFRKTTSDSNAQQNRFQNANRGELACKNECVNNSQCPQQSTCVREGCNRTCIKQQNF